MNKQEIPDFPEFICLEWDDGRRLRIDVLDISGVIDLMEQTDTTHAITYESFGAFVAAIIAYASQAEAQA